MFKRRRLLRSQRIDLTSPLARDALRQSAAGSRNPGPSNGIVAGAGVVVGPAADSADWADHNESSR